MSNDNEISFEDSESTDGSYALIERIEGGGINIIGSNAFMEAGDCNLTFEQVCQLHEFLGKIIKDKQND